MFRKFLADENGYALVLTLLFLPVFVGVGLLVIDIGRGNNAQSDLQAAADALALAGARELDQQPGAIADARAAMERVTNRVNFLDISQSGSSILLNYDDADTDGRPFFVAFLRAIPGDIDPNDPTGKRRLPGSDDSPITDDFIKDWITANDSRARYVLVQARSRDLNPFFFNPATRVSNNVPVAATAVATAKAYTCDLAPMYICNPFGDDLRTALATQVLPQSLHGKLFALPMNPSKSTEPGNLGFLRTGNLLATDSDFNNRDADGNPGGGTKLLMRALAGGSYERCIEPNERLYTQPGASPRALDALNSRFGYYLANKGEFSSDGPYRPAENVRKGWDPDGNSGCTAPKNGNETTAQINERLLRNPIMSPNTAPLPNGDLWNLTQWAYIAPDGRILNKREDGTYEFTRPKAGGGTETVPYTDNENTITKYPPYWSTLYGGSPPSQLNPKTTSRYQMYRYEVDNSELLDRRAVDGGEAGTPGQCYKGNAPKPAIDRRTLLMAVVDCAGQNINGTQPVETLGLVKVFLTHPATSGSNSGTMNVEVFEIFRNSEQRDTFLRPEALLVR